MKNIFRVTLLLICVSLSMESHASTEEVELSIGQKYFCDVNDYGNNDYPWSIVNIKWEFGDGIQYSNTTTSYTNYVWVDSYTSGQLYAKVSWTETKLGTSDNIWNHKSHTWYFTIKAPVTGASIPSSISVVADNTKQLSLALTPSNGSVESQRWYSDDTSVATVSNDGVVTGKWPGTANVYCIVNGNVQSNNCRVTVTEPSFSFIGFSIANNATGVDTRPNIVATFSHTINRGSNYGKIVLTDSKGQQVNGNVSISGSKLTFTPSKHLAPLSSYTLTIPANAIENKWGTAFTKAQSVSFTTADWKKMQLTAEPAYKFINRGDQITLKASTKEADIYYSIDGSEPTKRYTEPLTFTQNMTVKAIAKEDGYYDSPLLSQDYEQCVEIVERFPGEEPLYVYADVNPSITYTYVISEGKPFKDIRLLKDGTEEIDFKAIINGKTIAFVPSKPLALGFLYVLDMPEGAIVTEHGEESRPLSWHFATGNFPCAVATGSQELAAAIRTDGSLWTWGMKLKEANADDGSYSYTTVEEPTKFVSEEVTAVSSGMMHHALLKKDGSLWMWGRQLCGEFGNGSRTASATPVKVMDGVQSVSCGLQNTAVVKTDGTLWLSGRNDYGQVGNGQRETVTQFVKVMDNVRTAAMGGYSSYAIKQDGTLWQWGGMNDTQLKPRQILTQVQTVSVNGESTVVTKTDGSLWTWTESEPTPVQVRSGMAEASAGDGSYLAIGTDGNLWAWGRNDYGQLGNSQMTDVATPINMMAGVTAVQYGWKNAVALREDGSVWTWGLNSRGALGDETTSIGAGIYSATPSEVIEGRNPKTLEGINLPTETLQVAVNEKAVIPMRPVPLLADYERINWSIDNTTIATVSERGVVTGKKKGTAKATATIIGKNGSTKEATCQIEVGDVPVGITAASDSWTLCVSTSNGQIHISGVPVGQAVSIYDVSGTCIYRCRMTGSRLTVPVTHQGICIVRSGNQVRKVAVRR